MKRLIALLVLVVLTWNAPPALATRPATVVVRGEILDVGCYLTKALTGAIHRECAMKCMAADIPVGLITADSTVYVLSQFHDRAMSPKDYGPPDPFALCKSWVSYYVEVTGFIRERKGAKAIEVIAAKLLSKEPPPPASTK